MVDMKAPPAANEKARKASKAEKSPKAEKTPKKGKGPAKVTVDDRGNEIILSVYDWPDPVKPSAMLLPKVIRDRRANAKTRKVATIAVAASMAVIAALTIGAGAMARSSQGDLQEVKTSLASVQAEIGQFSGIAAYATGISERTTGLAAALGNQLDYPRLVAAVQDLQSDGNKVDSIEILLGAPCAGGDPFTGQPLLGCVKISGSADTAEDASAMLLAAREPTSQFILPSLRSVAAVDSGGFAFQLTVNFAEDFYVEEQFVTDPNLAPVTPSPAAPGAVTPTAAPTESGSELSQNPSLQNPSDVASVQQQAQNLVESTR